MRSIFYTREEVDAARRRNLPRLRQFVAECRREHPIPHRQELSAKDKCRLRIYREAMRGFKPYSPFNEQCVGLLFSDVVGLLAARNIFRAYESCLVLLTGPELARWQATGEHLPDGWYWYFGWKVHTEVPPRYRPDIVHAPPGGGASAQHEFERQHFEERARLGRALQQGDADYFPPPDGFEYWTLMSCRGATAMYDLWRYDGREATFVMPSIAGVCCEEGPIEEWYE